MTDDEIQKRFEKLEATVQQWVRKCTKYRQEVVQLRAEMTGIAGTLDSILEQESKRDAFARREVVRAEINTRSSKALAENYKRVADLYEKALIDNDIELPEM